MRVIGCIARCEHNDTLPLCKVCRDTLGAPYGATMAKYVASVTRISRTKATPHGAKGSVRQKHQNKTFKYMRVRPASLPHAATLFRLRQLAGEARFEESEQHRLLKEQYRAAPVNWKREIPNWDLIKVKRLPKSKLYK